MVDQANMTQTDGSTQSPPRAAAENVGEITNDIVSLAELQVKLCKLDTREAVGRLGAPAALLVVAAAVALGTIPVVLLLIAEALVAIGGFASWLALLTATVLGLGAAVVMAVVGWKKLRKPFPLFHRSRDELKRNISWIRRVLARADT